MLPIVYMVMRCTTAVMEERGAPQTHSAKGKGSWVSRPPDERAKEGRKSSSDAESGVQQARARGARRERGTGMVGNSGERRRRSFIRHHTSIQLINSRPKSKLAKQAMRDHDAEVDKTSNERMLWCSAMQTGLTLTSGSAHCS